MYLTYLSNNYAAAKNKAGFPIPTGCFLWCLLLTANVLAQQLKDTQINSHIKIESADWYAEQDITEPIALRNYYRQGLPDGENNNLPPLSSSQKKESGNFIYRVKIRNLSGNEIVSVSWQYNFFNPLTKELLQSHEFVSRERIKPNKRKTLYATSSSPPTFVIDVSLFLLNKKQPYLESATIKSVVFLKKLANLNSVKIAFEENK